ncbi:MAG: TerB family tellurite resistance protein [Rhizobacter sp.]|nr:TerB family tellurite resistance protein [Rhizobacter sp.]
MRSYPHNSPQAAARIVALTLLADGHLAKAELDVLDRLGVHEQIGLEREVLHSVLHTFCEDLLSTAHLTWADSCRIDPRTLAALMGEIDDPELRVKLMRICAAVVEADAHVADGEAIVLGAAVEHWGLQRAMLDGRVTTSTT